MKKRILFVGNSYTYYNDMPEKLFAGKAAEAGHSFDVTSVTKGGYKLSQFADPENEEGQRLREVTRDQKYDYVVLQDQSCNPIVDKESFLESVGRMKELLGDRTEKFILYATWGRKAGSPQLEELNLTSSEMTEKLAQSYAEAGDRFGMTVAYVGKAFAAYSKEHPEVDLYNPDLTHPSEAGSVLAAKTILAAVLSIS